MLSWCCLILSWMIWWRCWIFMFLNFSLLLFNITMHTFYQVKGYIYEMTMRIEDEDERIASLAKLFFNELSKKGSILMICELANRWKHDVHSDLYFVHAGSNPIYNLLPDILSSLSNQNISEDAFNNIMQFLINSIKKVVFYKVLLDAFCLFWFLIIRFYHSRTSKWKHLLKSCAIGLVELQVCLMTSIFIMIIGILLLI